MSALRFRSRTCRACSGVAGTSIPGSRRPTDASCTSAKNAAVQSPHYRTRDATVKGRMAVETRVQVPMPQMGESVTEGVVLEWHVKVGDAVATDDVLVEISTDKVDAEVPSPAGGTVVAILVDEGDTVAVGAPLCEIESGEAAPAAGADAPRWYGVGGQALPFATDEELLEFLDSAPVVEREDAGRGIGGVQKITLERDGVALHAAFRTIDVERSSARTSNSGPSL